MAFAGEISVGIDGGPRLERRKRPSPVGQTGGNKTPKAKEACQRLRTVVARLQGRIASDPGLGKQQISVEFFHVGDALHRRDREGRRTEEQDPNQDSFGKSVHFSCV